jgi:hypothetical protein
VVRRVVVPSVYVCTVFLKKKIRKSPVKGGCRRTIKRRKPRVEA